jgi:thioredoxin 1
LPGNKTFRRVFVAVLGVVMVGVLPSRLGAGEENKSPVQDVTDSSFESYVLKSNKPVLVDFWASWCEPCQSYGSLVDHMASEYKGRLRVARVDVTQNPSLSQHYGIQYLPTSLLVLKGKVVQKWVGVVSKSKLQNEIETILKKASES